MKNIQKILASLVLVFAVVACASGPKVGPGQVVKIDYKGTLHSGETFDSTEGKQPFTFMVGSGQVLPAFEENITGMTIGSNKKFTIKAAEAYGDLDPKKQIELPKEQVLKGQNAENLKEGATIFITRKLPDGRSAQAPVKVSKITDTKVIVDYNHPLAGQDLTFDVKVVEIIEQNATKAEATPEETAPETAPEAEHTT